MPSFSRIIFLLAPLALITWSCKKSASSSSLSDTGSAREDTLDTPRILYVNLECFPTSSGPDSCVLVNTMLVEGKLKTRFHQDHVQVPPRDGYVCVFSDKSSQEIARIPVDNPIRKHLDVFEESGKIAAHDVDFHKGTVSLRVHYQPAIQWLKVWHFRDSTSACIATINLSKL